ncbi:MAG: GntR family transcriptional regulator [Acidobacteria bacterium]|jgi:DNA-binding GntR family transcriptional regulator|nr:GntR family transcriptional regulator [Acidobacteriota bacterium]
MRKAEGALVLKSLKEQVYDYLRQQFQKHRLQPGETINMDATAKKLGISRTPLRDALIQLEMEGFVTISPRRGIFVNSLPLDEIREFYQVIGALESSALVEAFPQLGAVGLKKMDALNRQMQKAIDADDYDLFYEKNLRFHDAFISLCGNHNLERIINNLKKRLYDFPQKRQWIKEWEESSIREHQEIVDFLASNDPQSAALFLRDVHWSYAVQEKYIRKYYGAGPS